MTSAAAVAAFAVAAVAAARSVVAAFSAFVAAAAVADAFFAEALTVLLISSMAATLGVGDARSAKRVAAASDAACVATAAAVEAVVAAMSADWAASVALEAAASNTTTSLRVVLTVPSGRWIEKMSEAARTAAVAAAVVVVSTAAAAIAAAVERGAVLDCQWQAKVGFGFDWKKLGFLVRLQRQPNEVPDRDDYLMIIILCSMKKKIKFAKNKYSQQS
jgi:hypothetical protein